MFQKPGSLFLLAVLLALPLTAQNADLTLTLSPDTRYNAGEVGMVTATVTNLGPDAATAAGVRLTKPIQRGAGAASFGCIEFPDSVLCNIPTLAAGQSHEFRVPFSPPDAEGTFALNARTERILGELADGAVVGLPLVSFPDQGEHGDAVAQAADQGGEGGLSLDGSAVLEIDGGVEGDSKAIGRGRLMHQRGEVEDLELGAGGAAFFEKDARRNAFPVEGENGDQIDAAVGQACGLETAEGVDEDRRGVDGVAEEAKLEEEGAARTVFGIGVEGRPEEEPFARVSRAKAVAGGR